MALPRKLRGDVGDRVASHIVLSRVIDGKLEIKSGCRGKPQVFETRTQAQTPSDKASNTTQRRRSSEIQQVTEGISGGEGGARAQEVAGLRRLSSSEQDRLLQAAGIRSTAPVTGVALAIKTHVALPWSKLRSLRSWLKTFGVCLESEKALKSSSPRSCQNIRQEICPWLRRVEKCAWLPPSSFPTWLKWSCSSSTSLRNTSNCSGMEYRSLKFGSK